MLHFERCLVALTMIQSEDRKVVIKLAIAMSPPHRGTFLPPPSHHEIKQRRLPLRPASSPAQLHPRAKFRRPHFTQLTAGTGPERVAVKVEVRFVEVDKLRDVAAAENDQTEERLLSRAPDLMSPLDLGPARTAVLVGQSPRLVGKIDIEAGAPV